MLSATADRVNRPPSWKTSSVISLLVFSFHAISHHHAAEAFSAKSHLAKRPGFDTMMPDARRFSQQQYPPHAPRKLGTIGRPRTSYNQGRPFSSNFFATSTTGKSLNTVGSGEDDDDEVMWSCVIDPRCCDECLEYVEQRLVTAEDISAWAMKEEEDADRVTFKDKVSMAAAGITGITAFALLILVSGPGSWRFFLAGGLCAAASHAIPTPIDVVKVRSELKLY